MKSYDLQDEVIYSWKKDDEQAFAQFVKLEKLTESQAKQFRTYCNELLFWNKKFNITALTTVKQIVRYHFQDSLVLKKHVDLSKAQALVDVGSGGGFPGMPLKIMFPDLFVVLVEVNRKKIQFLEHMVCTLDLQEIEVYPLDWRTFLRKTEYKVDFVCARASLDMPELMRMFKPSCFYNKAELVYWASEQWQPGPQEALFLQREVPYAIGTKKRKLVFFGKK